LGVLLHEMLSRKPGLGDAKASQAALDRLTGSYAGGWAYQIAEVHAYLGATDEAFAWLSGGTEQVPFISS